MMTTPDLTLVADVGLAVTLPKIVNALVDVIADKHRLAHQMVNAQHHPRSKNRLWLPVLPLLALDTRASGF